MATLSPSLAIRPCCYTCRAVESSDLVVAPLCFGRGNEEKKVMRGGVVRNVLIKSPNWSLVSRGFDTFRAAAIQRTEQMFATSTDVDELKKVSSTYLFRTEVGGHVKVSVSKKNRQYVVFIEVSALELGASDGILLLSWGIYQSGSRSFMPLDSQHSAAGARTVDTAFRQNSSRKLALELEFQAKQTPFYLSFLLKSVSDSELSGSQIRSHRKTKFSVPIGFDRGCPAPLGLSFTPDGSMNFAFFSRNAGGVVLCLYNDSPADKPALELDLDPYVNRTGDVWHVSLESAWNFLSYGYQCKGSHQQGETGLFDAARVRLDPYAKITVNSIPDHGSGLLRKYLGRLSEEPAFDWTGDVRPNLEMEQLVVYRLNVMRFTEHKSSQLYSDVAGTFAGLAEKSNHFKDLGVNAVLLEPIFPFDEQKGPYFPRHFFSPTNLYGPSGGSVSAITSLKEMVKKFHANGIEVFLEVVFTHTAEDGALNGIDDLIYYYADTNEDLQSRNALNCNFPVVQRLILDSLQYWVTEFHIDGFCFINASHLLRGFHGELLSRPPLVEAIAFDPLLSKTKIIADCWDPVDLVPKETRFPHWKRWAEINTKSCYDVRNFLRGEGLLSELATRLCGSGDIFSSGRGPAFSLNFISRNFGLTLVDLVSFSGDELSSELSWNCGEEGPTNKTPILERRLKQIRNYIFILFVSLGVPVLNMGDECGQSCGGSSFYDDRKPFDWTALSTGFGMQTTQFISFLTSFRTRRRDLLQKRNFLKEENIDWCSSDLSVPEWEDPSSKFLAMTLKSDEPESQSSSGSSQMKGNLYIAFNAAGQPQRFFLPLASKGMAWFRLVDTALPFPGFFSDDGEAVVERATGITTYEMKSHSCTLFEARCSSS